MILYMYIAPGQGQTAPRGQSFDDNRNFLFISFQIIDDNSFWKIHCFTFFPHKSIRDQIWPCRKIGQGQPRVIIWTNLVVLEHPMLHTKFQGHWPFGCGEEDFLRFLPYMGMAAILVMWPGPFEQTFVPPSQGGSMWNLASIGLVVSEEKMFENLDIHTYGWQRPTYKLTFEPKGSGELISIHFIFKTC